MNRQTAFACFFFAFTTLACGSADLTVAPPVDDGGDESATGDGAADGQTSDAPGTDADGAASSDASDAGPDGDATSSGDAGSETDASPPGALFGSTAIDFGPSNCGGSALASKSLKITNGGGTTLHVAAAMQIGTSFAITAGASLSIDPGSSASVQIAPAAVPASATAATEIDDTLALTTDDPTNATVSLPVKLVAAGATLTLSPATVAFGSVSVGATSSLVPFTLGNSGNLAATVAFGAPTDLEFALHGVGGSIAASGSLPGTSVDFTPSASLAINASIPLTVTGAVCGTSVTSIPLSGAGVTGAATVSGDVSFGTGGLSPCGGAAAASQTITIGNSGGAAFTWTAVLAGSALVPVSTGGTQPMYALSSASATINPGDPASVITVTSLGVPFPSAVPGNYDDAVTITTTIKGDTPKIVHLSQAAQGAILAVDTTNIAFGSVAKGTSQSSTFKITNNGNADANVTATSNNGVFSVSPSTSTKVTAGNFETVSLTYAPKTTATQNANVTIGVGATDVMCQPLPAAITASGTGLSGGVGLDATTLDFGLVNCGATAGTKTFTLTNTGTAAMTWTTSLGKGATSPYALSLPAGASTSTGSLAAGASLTFTVTPSMVPATSAVTDNLYGDVVTIATDIAGDTAHTVALKETAQGAILAFVPATLDLGQVPLGSSSNGTFALQNTGNAGATVTLASSSSMFALTGLSAASAILAPGSTATSVGVTFSPGSTAATEASTVTPATSDVLCGALPTPMQLAGTGVTGHVSYSPSALDFGLTDCGSKASAQTITFSNVGGSAAYNLTSATFGTTAYTISPRPTSSAPVPVPIGGSVTLTVTPAAIPSTSAVTPNLYGDTLTITTDISGDTPKQFAISQTAQGSILTVSTSNIDFGGVVAGSEATAQFTVTNTGNLDGNVVFTNSSTSIYSLPSTTAPASGQATVTAKFTPASVTDYDDTAVVSVDSSTVLCQPIAVTSIGLRGRGTAGALAKLSATSLTFGNTDLPIGGRGTWCGTTAAAKTFTVTSLAATTAAAALTTSLASGSSASYTVSLSGTNPLPPSGVITITVTPKQIPTAPPVADLVADGYKDTLTIDSGIAGDSPYTVQIHQTPAGAVPTLSPSSITFPLTSVGATNTTAGNITVGTQGDVTLSFQLVSNNDEFYSVPGSFSVQPLVTKPATIDFAPKAIVAS
ncbi:MAG: beta strand repeat-containing protein, partial [Polyangiales bacterium]